jgi:hypothetical protein
MGRKTVCKKSHARVSLDKKAAKIEMRIEKNVTAMGVGQNYSEPKCHAVTSCPFFRPI